MSSMRSILYSIPFLLVLAMAILLGVPQRELDDSLWNKDLNGTHILITGATSGIGEALTMALLQHGATVTAVARSESKLQRLVAQADAPLERLRTVTLDLADLAAVGRVGKELSAASDMPDIDVLVNNAGMHALNNMFAVDAAVGTNPPYDRVFVVNYLSHVLLTELLRPRLRQPSARIIQITSSYHWGVDGSDLRPSPNNNGEMPMAARPGGSRGYYLFRTQRSYANSKLAQILHARALQQQQQQHGITAVSVCPGWVATHIAGPDDTFATRVLHVLAFPVRGWGISSALHAILGQFNTTTTGTTDNDDDDYFINSNLFRLAEWLLPRPTPGWFYAAGLRDVLVNAVAYIALVGQRGGAHVGPARSSPESYNATLATELHSWSLQALQPYL